MSSDNPFAVPETRDQPLESTLPGGFAVVDGCRILCGRQVQLPPVCVVTGRTDDLVEESESLNFASWRLVVRQRYVLCRYFLHRSIHRRRTLVRRGTTLMSLAGWFLLFLPVLCEVGNLRTSDALIGMSVSSGVFVLILSRLVAEFFRSRLRVASAVNREQNLLSGFRPEFFQALAAK